MKGIRTLNIIKIHLEPRIILEVLLRLLKKITDYFMRLVDDNSFIFRNDF